MPEDAAKAVPLLEQALQLEPTYGIAHAQIAWDLHIRFSRGGLKEEDRVAAVQHARAATTHGNDDATALSLAAFVIALEGRDSDGALKLFDRALGLSSSNIFALSFSAVILAWLGRSMEAIERAQLALRLSPYDRLLFVPYIALAQLYFYLGQFEAAADAAQSAIDSNPRFSVPRAMLAAALVRLGRVDEAKVAAQHALALEPGFTISGFAATVGIARDVYSRFAEAWGEAGLPER
jgi:tetratricopeptide (TPR) repeat protein